ncbi:hemolysin family protein [Pseudogemmobacter sp. W21_MBD1_M6]|uniref:hemolysin family protein n=1 Tax=Pseudogemmobacter sp. W21_MBD1_M6 TaxID=3240271 RepID=UPI003F98C565
MGDSEEGSNAALSAQDPTESRQRGFLGRIFDALSPNNSDDESGNGDAAYVSSTPFLLGMVNLRRMRVEDVAIPKVEIVSVPVDIKKDDLVNVFRESGLTRLPVYSGTLDTPIGLVHLKDLALKHGFDATGGRYNLRKMVRPLLFAPPSMPIGILLQKMQAERIHMALVIDEYGGVDGLVTLEDLIEQVLGEIEDEHDIAEGRYWTREKPGVYLAQARAPLEDFEAEIGMNLTAHDEIDEEEIDTLGGLVFMLSGRVPARGEIVQHPDGPEFEVVEADPRRIKRLRVRLPGQAAE